ncbi:DUF7524 family protein [Natrarchaeobius oligotrophus]|uniref:Uncharacterized protein n=1 Tax=Natrarchaeobius chitinivorans TaxID=1679083 RepID=A0A3N6MQ47_NATCH|nr:hypothetical protein [Natrarchaeobius chitinivorans]RQG99760.1 hypothetical protein EA472_13995 [Natrarchaeobius chitinivorans]
MRHAEITVHVNRGSANTLEASVESLETHRDAAVVLRGHERPAHVHCRLDGDLDGVARIDGPNYYVEPDEVIGVPIAVDADRIDEPQTGELEVVTGYGAESIAIDLTITPGPPSVDVDESLSKPNRPHAASDGDEPSPKPQSPLVDRLGPRLDLETSTVAVVVLAALALAIATATAATVGGPITMVGLAIVAGGLVVALWLLLQ